MINVKLGVEIPSVESTISTLTKYNNMMGIPIDYDRLLEYYSYYMIMSDNCRCRVERYIGYSSVVTLKDNAFLTWLKNEGVTTGFLATERGSISMSEESLSAVIATGLYSKELCSVIKMYSLSKTYAHKVSSLKNIIETADIAVHASWDNHRMIFVKPTWVSQNTGRIGMCNPALMNIAKELADIQTVPKGWKIIEIDSGQIEPRIIQSHYIGDAQLKKCTEMYQDAYYGYVHYCTLLTDEQIKCGSLDLKPVELSDEIKEKRKKFKTYGNAVMYGSTENRLEDPDKGAFINRIGGHPRRIAWAREIEKQIDSGKRVFDTVFGTPIDITLGPSEKNYPDKQSNAYRSHLIRCAINNPVQGTAGDLMRLSVKKADFLLMRHAPNSVILKYTHDSGTFAIHESDYDKVIDELKEITAYQVEDWIPILGEAVEGIKQSGELPRFI